MPFELQKRVLRSWGERLCRAQDIDPIVAIEALDVLDPKLDYWENKRLYAEELRNRGVKVEEEEVRAKTWEEIVAEREMEERERIRAEVMEEMARGMTYDEAFEYFRIVAGSEIAEKYRSKFDEWWEDAIRFADGAEVQKSLIGRLAEMLSTLERRVAVEKALPPVVAEVVAKPFEPPEQYRWFYQEWMRRFKGQA